MAKDYIIQKAVEFSKVKKKVAAGIDLATFEQQAKYDGCCAILIFDEYAGYTKCFSRTGEEYISMSVVGSCMQAWGEKLYGADTPLRSVAVIGEAWWPGKGQFNEISGAFRRGKPNYDLGFVINDVIPLDDFRKGYCPTPYRDRVANWKGILPDGSEHPFQFADFWEPGSSDPQERCNQLVAIGGFDGLVLRDLNGTWTVGSGTTGEIIKIKQKLSFDLKVIEISSAPGEKTGRDVYRLVVEFNGRRLGVGSGVPHKLADLPKLGDIVEVEAMDLSSDGLLREPRFKGIRYDKITADG